MPIEITCNSCSKRLRVPDNAAGKRVKCPQCQTVLSVPAAGVPTPAAGGTKAATGSKTAAGGSKTASSAGKAAVAENYHLKTEDGQTFGPVPKKELDSWLEEGRITAECQVLKDGSDQWQWATDLYPQLGGGEAAGGESSGFPGLDVGGGGGSGNPFDFSAGGGGAPVAGGGSVAVTPRGGGARATSTAGRGRGTAAASGELSDKSKMVAGLLCLFLGSYGVGRFYLGYTGIGIAQICTCGGCTIWSIVDCIQCFTGKMKDAKGRPLRD